MITLLSADTPRRNADIISRPWTLPLRKEIWAILSQEGRASQGPQAAAPLYLLGGWLVGTSLLIRLSTISSCEESYATLFGTDFQLQWTWDPEIFLSPLSCHWPERSFIFVKKKNCQCSIRNYQPVNPMGRRCRKDHDYSKQQPS